MAWHTITHSCGHTERHQLYGPGKTRDWRAAKLAEDPCEACRKVEQDAANAKAAAANAEAGLPALTGSDKQVAWAETVRAAKLDAIPAAIEELQGQCPKAKWPEVEGKIIAATDAMQAQTAASWWIDRRDLKVAYILADIAKRLPETTPGVESTSAAAAMAESTVRPEADETIPTVTEIRVFSDRVDAILPEKNDAFRGVVKAIGYTWTGTCWSRAIDAAAGPVSDRAAELGNRLLAAGFPIRIHDPAIRSAAISGQFAPEHRRWIKLRTSGEHAGKLVICWPREDDLYSVAKALSGARYDKPNIVIPVDRHEAVLDFAEAYGFAISPSAQTAIDAARAARAAALLATPAKAPKTKTGPGPKPAATGEVADELRDEEF